MIVNCVRELALSSRTLKTANEWLINFKVTATVFDLVFPVMIALTHLEASTVHGIIEFKSFVSVNTDPAEIIYNMSRKGMREVVKSFDERKRVFKCSYCDQESTEGYVIVRHIKQVDEMPTKPERIMPIYHNSSCKSETPLFPSSQIVEISKNCEKGGGGQRGGAGCQYEIAQQKVGI